MQFFFSRNMAGGIEIKVNLENEKFNGKKAKFKFALRAMGQGNQHVDKLLLESEFEVQSQQMVFNVPAEKIQNWLYKGRSLNIYYHAGFFVDEFFGEGLKGEAIFNDEKYFKIYTVTLSKALPDSVLKVNYWKGLTVNYWKTFLIMSFFQKFILLLAVAVILLVVGNLFSPLFSKTGQPIIVGLATNSLLFVIFAFFFIVGCFVIATNFIKVQFISPLPKISHDSQLRLSQLIRSNANLDLRGLSVELVGHVIEKYQYVRHSRRGSSVKNAIQSVNDLPFFNQNVDFLPKGASLESSASQTIDFGKFYGNIVPNFEINPSYGVSMMVDLFIRSKEFPDIRLEIPLEAMEKVSMP